MEGWRALPCPSLGLPVGPWSQALPGDGSSPVAGAGQRNESGSPGQLLNESLHVQGQALSLCLSLPLCLFSGAGIYTRLAFCTLPWGYSPVTSGFLLVAETINSEVFCFVHMLV